MLPKFPGIPAIPVRDSTLPDDKSSGPLNASALTHPYESNASDASNVQGDDDMRVPFNFSSYSARIEARLKARSFNLKTWRYRSHRNGAITREVLTLRKKPEKEATSAEHWIRLLQFREYRREKMEADNTARRGKD